MFACACIWRCQNTEGYPPLSNLVTIEQNWSVASNASVGLGQWSAFSALGWFFGRDVFTGLGSNVPLGLVYGVLAFPISPLLIAH